ncbi:MAG: hypothetical protein L6Q97_27530, partial [Thermoanaerobaculia bacterium]|nr:hypothetical protein [Thermoanaerobaculia bacterium]
APVVRVNRRYIDAATGEQIHEKEEFIESLTHDSIIIQIPYLEGRRRTELEQLLSLFDQSGRTDDPHFLTINEDEMPERYRPLLRRLQKAIADPIVRETMEAEDDLIEEFRDYQRLIAAKEGIIAEKEKAIREKEHTIQEKEHTIQEKEHTIQENKLALSENEKIINEQQRQLENAVGALSNSGLTPEQIAAVLEISLQQVKAMLDKAKQ